QEMKMSSMFNILMAGILFVMAGCVRPPLKGPGEAMRPTGSPDLSDDLPLAPLLRAVSDEIVVLSKFPAEKPLVFGDRAVSVAKYIEGLKLFLELAEKNQNPPD